MTKSFFVRFNQVLFSFIHLLLALSLLALPAYRGDVTGTPKTDMQTPARIFTGHVVPFRAFSTNLTAGNVTTVQGGTVAVPLKSEVDVGGNGNRDWPFTSAGAAPQAVKNGVLGLPYFCPKVTQSIKETGVP